MAMADGYGLFWNSDSGDRKYDAKSFEKWLKKFFTSGVFEGDLQVLASSGMTVQVQTGYSNLNGKVGLFESATDVTLSAANSRYPRIDTIIIERNDVDRVIQIDKVTGAYTGENPHPTAPIWDETQGIYQLVLAQIYVGAGVSSISQEDITDKRTDTDVCGYIAGTVNEMDFSQFTAQFEAYFSTFEATQLAEFEEWFDHMKDQLDSDAAGHLQAEVDEINGIIAPVQSTLTASQPYAIGEQFIYGGKLYTATSAIAEGGTIVIGTNASLSDEIVKQIKSAKDDLVVAVNEVVGNIGSLNSLDTDVRDSVVNAINSLYAQVNARNAGSHNSIYRGKNLGTSVTAAQWASIQNGTFLDMYIGDYWVINGITWRIAAFDYWLGFGDTACSTHHIVIVPDENLLDADGSTTHYMNTSNVTTGAYIGSGFRSGTNADNTSNTARSQCRAKAQAAFGNAHILTHRDYFANAMSNGRQSSGSWYDSDIDLMNEIMVYGCLVFAPTSDGSTIPANYTIGNSQLPLFRLNHKHICNRANWWLRDAVSAAVFTDVHSNGNANYSIASYAGIGVRPAFGIC